MLYICEYIQIGYEMKFNPGAMGNGTFNHNGSASCNFHGYSKPLIKINITPTFPEPKPVKIGYMVYPSYHSKIDCKNLIILTKEQYCKDKKR